MADAELASALRLAMAQLGVPFPEGRRLDFDAVTARPLSAALQRRAAARGPRVLLGREPMRSAWAARCALVLPRRAVYDARPDLNPAQRRAYEDALLRALQRVDASLDASLGAASLDASRGEDQEEALRVVEAFAAREVFGGERECDCTSALARRVADALK